MGSLYTAGLSINIILGDVVERPAGVVFSDSMTSLDISAMYLSILVIFSQNC